jgi:hypothetical protein
MRSACRDASKLLSSGFAASAVVVGFKSSSAPAAAVTIVRARFASGPRVGLVDIANEPLSKRSVVVRGDTFRGVGTKVRLDKRFLIACVSDADADFEQSGDARIIGRGIARRWRKNVAIVSSESRRR